MHLLDPTTLLLVFALVFTILVSAFGWLIWKKQTGSGQEQTLLFAQQMDSLRQQMADSLTQSMSLVSQQMAQMTSQINTQMGSITQQLSQTTGQIGQRLDNAARVVGEVRQNLGELSKAAERIFEVGKDISSLQEILRAPKLRGTLGELFLGDLLSQILPPNHFTLQYAFREGEMVDAVIHLGQGLVPIDAKFPLENFRRMIESQGDEEKKVNRRKFATDLKRHIDLIATKYILPDEGTFDFALMYIPAENVYYETMIRDEALGDEKSLSNYALSRRVIPVSPSSFYAYLQAIVLGLKGLRIEKSAREIIQHLGRLQGDFARFREDFEVLGKHLNNIRGRYDEASKRLDRFGEKLTRSSTTLSAPGGELSPETDEPAPVLEEQSSASGGSSGQTKLL
ncbi:MAG: DNA recombination protein RmuC [Nitrospira sp.]|nr:DNA recombination protein RmuC [Nitrospira sp.]